MSPFSSDVPLFSYVGNRPLGSTDPSGLEPWENRGTGSGGAWIPWDPRPVPRARPSRRFDLLDEATNFFSGFADIVTVGLTKRYRNAIGADYVDYEGGVYKTSQAVGTAESVALSVVNPCNAVGWAGHGIRAVNGVQAVGNVVNGVENVEAGNYGQAALDFVGAAGNVAQMTRQCFAAGTPLVTPEGSKPIEEFAPGDVLLSAPEDDPEGPVEPRRVLEVFRRMGRLFHLRVGGQLVRTTGEHPFYAQDKGWTAASLLVPGDLLRGHDGRWTPVESVEDGGEDATVYNLRIDEYHTYFVGSPAWGFSAWSHNANYTPGQGSADAPARVSPGQLGREGEALASEISGAGKNTQSFVVNGRTRIPDQVLAQDIATRQPTIIGEVKNVQRQALTRQLRDDIDLVGPGGRVDVYLPPGAQCTRPLLKAFADPRNPLNRVPLVRPE